MNTHFVCFFPFTIKEASYKLNVAVEVSDRGPFPISFD